MNNSLNEYLRFNFELNIELNHFLARFNVKMNNQNVSATLNPDWLISYYMSSIVMCVRVLIKKVLLVA